MYPITIRWISVVSGLMMVLSTLRYWAEILQCIQIHLTGPDHLKKLIWLPGDSIQSSLGPGTYDVEVTDLLGLYRYGSIYPDRASTYLG